MGRKGFSIVSVMVASVLVGVLAVGLASMLRDSTRGARSVQAMSEITDRYNEISLMLKAPELCKDGMITPGAAGALAKVNDTSVTAAAFPGAVVALDRLVLKGSQLARLNANFGNTGMRVQNLQLALDPGASEVGASQRRYTARLRIGLQGAANVRQRQTNVWDQSKDFRLSLLVNRATGDIVSCTLEGDGDAQMPDCGEGQVWGKARVAPK